MHVRMNNETSVDFIFFFKDLFVFKVAPTLEDTEMVIKRVAPVQRTLFGDMWTFTSDNNRADTAYTTIPLAAHNDSTYLTEATG